VAVREILSTAAVVVVVVISGLVHGSWTNRWEKSQALAEAVASLQHMPRRLGDWRGEELEMDARQFQRAGVDGYKAMGYVDPFDGSTITTLLLVGRPGPVSVHTPGVCYGGAGYEMLGAPTRYEVAPSGGGPPAEFWVARFRKEGLGERHQLRIFWAWRPWGGAWQAADNPRLAFGRVPALCKLYVVREMTSPDEPLEDDPALGLIRLLLACLGKAP
jgi:hypothetical protein